LYKFISIDQAVNMPLSASVWALAVAGQHQQQQEQLRDVQQNELPEFAYYSVYDIPVSLSSLNCTSTQDQSA
jgi:hypothetical protein